MEEHIWNLVEKFISGAATDAEQQELQRLLAVYPALYISVKEFLSTYEDAEPQVTPAQIQHLLTEVDNLIGHTVPAKSKHLHKPAAAMTHTAATAWPAPSRAEKAMDSVRSEMAMAAHFFKIAVRNLQRNRAISLINICGLAVGIASAVLILLWVQNQLSYDQFHQNKDRVVQLFNRTKADGKMQAWSSTPIPLGPALKAEYPQVEDIARINWVGAFVLKNGNNKLETQGFITDPGFFKIFSFPLVKGNPASALSGIHSIVLTQKLAKKLFGSTDPMGKIVKVDSIANFTVTGVAKDQPNNTTFNFEYLIPWNYMKEVGWDNNNWKFHSVQTYALLKPGISLPTANRAFKNIYRQHDGENTEDIFVHPMSKWWLYSRSENGQMVGGRIEIVHLFMIIAGLIMMIACINYMNLGTARSARRAKEVGIRKVSGAGKQWLIKQFLGESVLIAFVSGAIGLLLVKLSLTWFNALIGVELFIPYSNPLFWLSGVGFILFTGVISGSYPAFYLSGFKPVNVLKGTFKAANALVAPRKILVVVQFTFAIAFIICTAVIYRQIKFVQNRDTGYNLNNLAYIFLKGDAAKNYPIINSELLRSGAVSSVTRTNSPILDVWNNNDSYEWPGKDPAARQSFAEFVTDKDFAKTLQLPIIKGRDIDVSRYPADTLAILLNEHAAKSMGFANPIGQQVKSWKGNLHVVGVVKNFVTGSPYLQSLPVVIQGATKQFGTVTLKLNNNNSTANNIKTVAAIFKKHNPDYPFDCKFYDQSYSVMFQDDKNAGTLAAVFAGLTIFISCLGLFALAACMAEGRVKEIGIRKVLGASVARIATLLTQDFLVLVCISFVIAAPIAWWLMSGWLQNYPYHANLSWWIFGLTGLSSIGIAFSTVIYQAVKAAIVNPVRSLKTE